MRVKRYAIYRRISTNEDLQKYSLEAQLKECKLYGKRQGWQLFQVYTDQFSGESPTRYEFEKLRDDMAKGKFDIILCVDQDRVSRMDEIDWGLFKRELKEYKVILSDTSGRVLDFENEDSECISDIFNVFSRYQKRKLIKAIRRGSTEKAERGCFANGRVPFGYDYCTETGKLIPNENSILVKKMYELYLNGFGFWKIAKELNNKITSRAVKYALKNEVYLGHIIYRGTKEVRIENAHKPIIDQEMFNQVQKLLQKRSEKYQNCASTKRKRGLVAGLITCSECGLPLNIRVNQNRQREYVYAYYLHRQGERKKEKHFCNLKFKVEDVDGAIIKTLKTMAKDPIFARQVIYSKNSEVEKRNLLQEQKELHKRLSKNHERREKLLELYLDSNIEKSFLEIKNDELDKEALLIQQELQQVDEQLRLYNHDITHIDTILAYFTGLEQIEKWLSEDDQRKVVSALFPEVKINAQGEMKVTCRIPVNKEQKKKERQLVKCQSNYEVSGWYFTGKICYDIIEENRTILLCRGSVSNENSVRRKNGCYR